MLRAPTLPGVTTTDTAIAPKSARQTSKERVLAALRDAHFENVQVANTDHVVDRPYDPPRYYGRGGRQQTQRLRIDTTTITGEFTIYTQYGSTAGTEEARVRVTFVFDAEGRFQKDLTSAFILEAATRHGLYGHQFNSGESLTSLLKSIAKADPVAAKQHAAATSERQAAAEREREEALLASYGQATQVANDQFTALLRALVAKHDLSPGVALTILDGFTNGDWNAWLGARAKASSIGSNVAVEDPISEVAKREGVVLR